MSRWTLYIRKQGQRVSRVDLWICADPAPHNPSRYSAISLATSLLDVGMQGQGPRALPSIRLVVSEHATLIPDYRIAHAHTPSCSICSELWVHHTNKQGPPETR